MEFSSMGTDTQLSECLLSILTLHFCEGWGQHGEFGGGGEGEEQGLLRARDWNNRFSSQKFQLIFFQIENAAVTGTPRISNEC